MERLSVVLRVPWQRPRDDRPRANSGVAHLALIGADATAAIEGKALLAYERCRRFLAEKLARQIRQL